MRDRGGGRRGRPARERPDWLARREGEALGYLCFGSAEVRAWALASLSRLVEDYGASWIKVDFNLDPQSCDEIAHGHGAGDGLYAHVRGLYEVLGQLRERHPDLILEACSSGGLRIDYGLLRYADYVFLSDPDYTRHHLSCFWGALDFIHPAALYHFSHSDTFGEHNFDWDEDGERRILRRPLRADTPAHEVDYRLRACLLSPVGLSLRLVELPEAIREQLRLRLADFARDAEAFVRDGQIWRLTPQPARHWGEGPDWAVFQQVARDGRQRLTALRSPGPDAAVEVRLRGLDPEQPYRIRDEDTARHWTATGRELMTEGLRLEATTPHWSAVYLLEPDPSTR